MRIAGVNIPVEKKVYVSLTSIFGIGFTTSKKICEVSGVDPELRVRELSEAQVSAIRDYITENCEVEGILRSQVSKNIKAKKDMKSYQGLRHIKRLPVRGQNSKNNARTRKGRSAPIANKKK